MSAAVVPASASSSSPSDPAAPSSKRSCPLCGKAGLKVCSGCSRVGYCSKEHQREHWPEHKRVCAQKHKLLAPSPASSSASSALSAAPKEEISVTWADQQSINLFSRLNARLSLVDDQLRALSKAHANLLDAADTVDSLLDDDAVMVRIGEVYVRTSNEAGEAFVKAERTNTEAKRAKLEAEKADIEQRMAALKKTLYGKFGKAINLENADQTIND